MAAHWGDLPILRDTESGIAAVEREQLTKARPMEIEGPRLHQPSSQHHPPSNELHPAEFFSIDALTLHTIKLIQYSRRLRLMIQNVHQQIDSRSSESSSDLPSFPAAPPIPEYSGRDMKHQLETPVPYLHRDIDSDFVRGKGKAPPEIDSTTNRKLLRKSVAALCAHAGFDNCAESILEIMTDVLHEYMLQMTKLLREAVDQEALYGNCGFPDPVERVFYEMGVGSMTTLHDFYQTRVISYHKHMLDTCNHLQEEYEKAKCPDVKPPEDSKLFAIKVKEEQLSDIVFPALEESDDTVDPDQMLGVEGLGLDMPQEPSGTLVTEEEKPTLMQTIKMEPLETKVSTLDAFDQEDGHSSTGPYTPQLGSVSDAGDSIHDPGSVPVTDIMSPPSVGMRPPNSKPPKKKRKH